MTPNVTDRFDDNTRISAYKDCPRKYFLRHVKHWTGTGTAAPLVFGGAWHAGQDLLWTHAKHLPKDELRAAAIAGFMEVWVESGFPETLDAEQTQAFNPRTPGIAEEMYHHYIEQRWTMLTGATLIQAEQPFAVPLPNLEKSWYVGRLDKVVEYNGQKLVLEHKTTAIYRTNGGFDPKYIEGWYSDSQVKGYQFGAGLYYPGLTQVWVDCALAHKTVHDSFKFVPVSHSFDIIREWLDDAQEWVSRIVRDEQLFERHGHLTPGCFPKNENSCYNKFGSCSYLDICRTQADIPANMEPPDNFLVEKWEPFTTLGLDKILNKE